MATDPPQDVIWSQIWSAQLCDGTKVTDLTSFVMASFGVILDKTVYVPVYQGHGPDVKLRFVEGAHGGPFALQTKTRCLLCQMTLCYAANYGARV